MTRIDLRARLRLYLVLDETLCGARGVVETAREAVAGGAGMVQLRAKGATTRERIEAGAALKAALAGTGALLIVNDDAEAAGAIGADGLHIGQGDIAPAAARALIGPAPLLGLSIETVEHARHLDPSIVDYAGAGPVFATATKPDHAQPLGHDGLARLLAACPVPAVAIGGIDEAQAAEAIRAGAAGVAVVSAICGRAAPRAAAANILSHVRNALEETRA